MIKALEFLALSIIFLLVGLSMLITTLISFLFLGKWHKSISDLCDVCESIFKQKQK